MAELEMLIEKFEDVAEVVERFEEGKGRFTMYDLTHTISTTRESIKKYGIDEFNVEGWIEWFQNMGAMALSVLANRFSIHEFSHLLLNKHRRYGKAPLENWGVIGIVMRMDSKVERINNMSRGQELALSDESIYDSLQDIVGYCVLGTKLMEEKLA